MDISAGSAGFASSDLQHGRVGVHRKNLAFRLASLERDRQGARAATDIDDPIARLRCDKLQQVASPPFLAGHERDCGVIAVERSEEHTSELQSLMRISYAVFCLTKNTTIWYVILIIWTLVQYIY